MLKPPIPPDEAQRLESLYRLGILDTSPEERFDRLTRLASHLFEVPIALVSMVAGERQWFKSRQGLDPCETSRDVSFCSHALLDSEILEVPDAAQDSRFHDNPLVTGPPDIRFYAGAPLSSPDGYLVGTLCIIDTVPRKLTERQRSDLRDLADCVQQELGKVDLEALIEFKNQAEAELRETKARLDRAIAGTSDGLWDWNVNSDRIWFAPRFKELLGYTQEEFPDVVASLVSRIHPEDLDATKEAVRAHLRDRVPYDIEHRLRTKSGEYLWFKARGQAVWDAEGRAHLMSGSIMDISRHKEAEARLIEAKERAEETSRLKDEFLNMVSHELRTPLTVVLGYLPILQKPETLPPPELVAEIATDMRQAGDHLLQVINDLLDLSRIESGKLELHLDCVEVAEIATEVCRQFRDKAASKGLRLEFDVERTEIRCDPLRLRQILINLVGNAIKFTNEGAIRVTGGAVAGGGIQLAVTDTGIGISEADQSLIFDHFRQVDSTSTRKVGGSGLGLAITRRLAQLHGGEIHVRSRLGAGSTFTLELPEA